MGKGFNAVQLKVYEALRSELQSAPSVEVYKDAITFCEEADNPDLVKDIANTALKSMAIGDGLVKKLKYAKQLEKYTD